MSDRRRFIRWQINRQAKIKLEGAETFADCTISDINFKGLRISLRIRLEKDTSVKLSLALSDEFTLNIEAWVVWHKSIDGFNVYGLYFTKIIDSDKEEIYKFVYKNFPKEITKQWWRDLTKEKGGETMQDRRIFERFAVQLPLRFLDLESGKEGRANTYDLGAKGIGFIGKVELTPKTTLEMWLEIPDQGEPLYTRGEVVWSKMVEPSVYRAGVNLEKADMMGLSRVLRVKLK